MSISSKSSHLTIYSFQGSSAFVSPSIVSLDGLLIVRQIDRSPFISQFLYITDQLGRYPVEHPEQICISGSSFFAFCTDGKLKLPTPTSQI